MIRTSLLVGLLVLSACASESRKPETVKPNAPAVPIVSTTEQISERYGLKELDAAANALKVVFDQSLAASNDQQGEAVLGCPVKGDDARRMMQPLKALIDEAILKERDQYVADPKSYARDRSFETCAATCSCGSLANVLEPVNAKTLKSANKSMHDRFLVRLQKKAAIQGPDASLACARKQAWFCRSDLQAYLESEANKSGL